MDGETSHAIEILAQSMLNVYSVIGVVEVSIVLESRSRRSCRRDFCGFKRRTQSSLARLDQSASSRPAERSRPLDS